MERLQIFFLYDLVHPCFLLFVIFHLHYVSTAFSLSRFSPVYFYIPTSILCSSFPVILYFVYHLNPDPSQSSQSLYLSKHFSLSKSSSLYFYPPTTIFRLPFPAILRFAFQSLFQPLQSRFYSTVPKPSFCMTLCGHASYYSSFCILITCPNHSN